MKSLEWVIKQLSQLIEIPSISRDEDKTANFLASLLLEEKIPYERHGNNIWAQNAGFDTSKPTLLLNSHHDTVKPNAGYKRDPWQAEVLDGALFGLGSTDAGGSLLCLLATFIHFYAQPNLPFNLIWSGTAEEEISGNQGIESILPKLPPIAAGIVGEPTQMNLAIAEKGLLVLDCIVQGKSGHAARREGINAINQALPILQWFHQFEFPKTSSSLGTMQMQVTQIQAGTQHNVVPDACHFTVDVRVTDAYTLEETLEIIQSHVNCQVQPRSVRLRSSSIPIHHPLVQAGIGLGRTHFGSPTLSDQALMPFPTVKVGPGYSGRSHTADEFILLSELQEGLEGYIALLNEFIIKINRGETFISK